MNKTYRQKHVKAALQYWADQLKQLNESIAGGESPATTVVRFLQNLRSLRKNLLAAGSSDLVERMDLDNSIADLAQAVENAKSSRSMGWTSAELACIDICDTVSKTSGEVFNRDDVRGSMRLARECIDRLNRDVAKMQARHESRIYEGKKRAAQSPQKLSEQFLKQLSKLASNSSFNSILDLDADVADLDQAIKNAKSIESMGWKDVETTCIDIYNTIEEFSGELRSRDDVGKRGADAVECIDKLKDIVTQMQRLHDSSLDEHVMVGPVGAAKTGGIDEIADFRRKLNQGIVVFSFVKADGTLRNAVGTTSRKYVPAREQAAQQSGAMAASIERRKAYTIWFWDLQKDAFRCFNTNRFGQLEEFVPDTDEAGQRDLLARHGIAVPEREWTIDYTVWVQDKMTTTVVASSAEEAKRKFFEENPEEYDMRDFEIQRIF